MLHALLKDPELLSYSRQTLVTAEIAPRYGISEAERRHPPSYREMLGAPRLQHPARVI